MQKRLKLYISVIIAIAIYLNIGTGIVLGQSGVLDSDLLDEEAVDTLLYDGDLPFKFSEERPFSFGLKDSLKLFLLDPDNIEEVVTYSAEEKAFIIEQKVGDITYRMPYSMSLEDYIEYDLNRSVTAFWRDRFASTRFESGSSGLLSLLSWDKSKFLSVFGLDDIEVKPQGFLELSIGAQISVNDNPALTEQMRRVTSLEFDENINFGVTGSIGDQLTVAMNYNSNATFDFENQLKIAFGGNSDLSSGISNKISKDVSSAVRGAAQTSLNGAGLDSSSVSSAARGDYQSLLESTTGGDDKILKYLGAGNVSMETDNSLIGGSSNLFGVRADMQFGRLSVSAVVSQQKGETVTVQAEGGAIKSEFDIEAVDYDEDRHYFLGHYFHDSYDAALSTLPLINSQININRIEVWVTNSSSQFTSARNFVAFADLGEKGDNRENLELFPDTQGASYPDNVYPDNDVNSLYSEITSTYSGIRDISNVTTVLSPLASQNFVVGDEYEKVESARLLTSSEYRIHENLGYITLTSALRNDEVLAVAYTYTASGKVYQVGEFSSDGINAPESLVLKLLKPTVQSPSLKSWDLMMKNIYRLDTYNISEEDFRLDVVYRDATAGRDINYLPDGPLREQILLKVMNSDNLNTNGDASPDGIFDWTDGITVNPEYGEIIFPVVEPFGSNLENQMESDQSAQSKYVFNELYDSSKSDASEIANKNRFSITGFYKGDSNSEIRLSNSFNLTQGSVRVTAGGRELTENVDFVVDYTMGTVKIINQGLLDSDTTISISSESEDMFSVARKTMAGLQANYQFNDKFMMGGTLLYLHEKSLTTKPTDGDDAISNLMVGANARYISESNIITDIIDKLPTHSTKEKSFVTIEGEFAKLYPGNSNSTGETGSIYLDDFEGSQNSISLKAQYAWKLASTPADATLWPEGALINDLRGGYNRSRLAWYNIDPILQRLNSNTPTNIRQDPDIISKHSVREIYYSELFPEMEIATGDATNILTFDLAYYPEERGPYNYNTEDLESDGTLKDPEERWGGIMREISTSDFEAANIEYLEFWVMDPFADTPDDMDVGGDLYIHLGNISEDVLKDSKKSFENGLPADGEDDGTLTETTWGRLSTQQSVVNAFDNDATSRENQDVGLDGLSSVDEKLFFTDYLNSIKSTLTSTAYSEFEEDPSGDDFHYYRGTDYDDENLGVLERYKKFNSTENNSPTDSQSTESYGTAATSTPDVEDINGDNTLSESESYFQYRVKFDRSELQIGSNNIIDTREATVTLANGELSDVTWYQFRVPLSNPDDVIGSISDFSSVRFMRLAMRNWEKPVVLRFASLELVYSDWRKYEQDLFEDDVVPSPSTVLTNSSVNIEENSTKQPVNYVLPPGVDRVIDPINPEVSLNEQAMSITVTDLADGDAQAVYKQYSTDMRRYNSLRMYVHAEAINESSGLEDGDVALFIRLGTDYNENYYEYEVPLTVTPSGYYSSSNSLLVWPEANLVDIPLTAFTDVKLSRDGAMGLENSIVTLDTEYELPYEDVNSGQNRIKVKGKPTLGEVSSIMIGVRNLQDVHKSLESVEVWVNELRISDVEKDGGWAANLSITGNLADVATYSISGQYVSSGFGSIYESVESTSLYDYSSIDISTSIELGKLVPKKLGLEAPMFIGYSKEVYEPEYNPLDTDVKLEDALEALSSDEEREALESIVNTVTTRNSINLTNVRVNPELKRDKSRFYDVANFYGSYAFNSLKYRDIDIESKREYNTRLVLGYDYSFSSKPFTPFKKLIKSPSLALIRDFNINYLPSKISFLSDINSYYSSQTYRNISNPDFIIETQYVQDFEWLKSYNIQWNIFQSMRLNFTSNQTNRVNVPTFNEIDEDAKADKDPYKAYKKSVIDSILNGNTRPVEYDHSFSASYTVPFNKVPLLNWVSGSVGYDADYYWEASSILSEESTIDIGNHIDNRASWQLTGNAMMSMLYGKSSYLKRIDQLSTNGASTRSSRSSSRSSSSRSNSTKKSDTEESDSKKSEKKKRSTLRTVVHTTKINVKKPGGYLIRHKLNTKDIKVQAKGAQGRAIKGELTVLTKSKVMFTVEDSLGAVDVRLVGKVDLSKAGKLAPEERVIGTLLMLKSFSGTYSDEKTSSMYGFTPEVGFMGSKKYGNISAPGLGFAFGKQDDNFPVKAINNGWITTDSLQIEPFMTTHSNTINLRANVVPIPKLKIELDASRTYFETKSEYYIYDHSGGGWDLIPSNQIYSGSYQMSVISWGSAFETIGGVGSPDSEVFDTFLGNRKIVAERFSNIRPTNTIEGYNPTASSTEDSSYPDGYGPSSADVIIPAFFSAYTGESVESVSLSPFPKLSSMRPNWRAQYVMPLQGISWLNKKLNSLTLNHSYSSIYSVDSYQSNFNYEESSDGYSYERALDDNFSPKYDITSLSLNESLSPIIGVDIKWQNSLTMRLETSRVRSIIFSLANSWLTESVSKDITVGASYKIENLKLFLSKTKQGFSNDLFISADLGIREAKTMIRKVSEGENLLTQGQKSLTYRVNADYALSTQFSMAVYVDNTTSDPYVSQTFSTSTTNFGLTFRFNLDPSKKRTTGASSLNSSGTDSNTDK